MTRWCWALIPLIPLLPLGCKPRQKAQPTAPMPPRVEENVATATWLEPDGSIGAATSNIVVLPIVKGPHE